VDLVPALAKTMTSAAAVLPTLKHVRVVFEKLRDASDTLDASFGQVVNAVDVVIDSTTETVTACESALKRIKTLLER
jgi:hypothetical protein